MDTQALLEEISSELPPIPKPHSRAIPFHRDGCGHCELLRDDLEQYTEPTLPPEAIRYLHDEWSCLSSQATRWVLPSYLKHCIVQDTYDGLETEFLIYSLRPAPQYEADTRQRLRGLKAGEVTCLLHFLEWCSVHPHWSTYCPEDIALAIQFVRSILGEGAQPELQRTSEE
jgi:hypothetical protein